jgi:hypothetical protein
MQRHVESYFGVARNLCTSLRGDIFTLDLGQKVLVTKIYRERGYVECSAGGSNGIFRLDDIIIQDGSLFLINVQQHPAARYEAILQRKNFDKIMKYLFLLLLGAVVVGERYESYCPLGQYWTGQACAECLN